MYALLSQKDLIGLYTSFSDAINKTKPFIEWKIYNIIPNSSNPIIYDEKQISFDKSYINIITENLLN
tara:strand:+ start:427 stop:627 length:201 start_codon:yes stop_codon:yes gene_type:complete